MEYEFEPELEESYRMSLIKSFKRQVDDGFFPFIIVDCIHNKVKHFAEMATHAKKCNFEVCLQVVFKVVCMGWMRDKGECQWNERWLGSLIGILYFFEEDLLQKMSVSMERVAVFVESDVMLFINLHIWVLFCWLVKCMVVCLCR